jgi:E3 ubiquitin-protein ligase DOA10
MDLGEGGEEMCAPCLCAGTIKYMHINCMKEWIKEKKSINCELCSTSYSNKWKLWALENNIIKLDVPKTRGADKF